jgi:hypothetical protein
VLSPSGFEADLPSPLRADVSSSIAIRSILDLTRTH